MIDLRGSAVNLTGQANTSVTQSTSSPWPGTQCPEYSISGSPSSRVLVDPIQTSHYGCECVPPWEQSAAKDTSSQPGCMLVPEQLHVLANPVLPLPNAGRLTYDPEHVWWSVALFTLGSLLALGVLLCMISMQVYRIQGSMRAKGKISSTLPGLLTDVLGQPQVDHSKGASCPDAAHLMCAPQAVTLVVVRMDPMDYTGKRPPLPRESEKAYMEVCQV